MGSAREDIRSGGAVLGEGRNSLGTEGGKITEKLADFVVGTRYEDFSPEVRHIAKRCVIDGIAVILAGSAEPCACILLDHVISLKGERECTILGKRGTQVPVRLAALVNATAGHAMDWDDTAISSTSDRGVLLHPTLPPLVAGLAIGKERGSGLLF
jgi:2-methylcitrate dehydratase PrpD